MRLPPNETPNNEHTQGEIDVTSVEEALAEVERKSSTASPVSSDTESEPQSSKDDIPTRYWRNTIMTSKQKEVMNIKTEGGTGLSIGTRKHKIREPSMLDGDRDNLRGWLAHLSVYFQIPGWEEDHDEDKIKYTTCLLRGDTIKWHSPYSEKVQAKSWTTWDEH